MAHSKYQTLNGFILSPFRNTESLERDTKFNDLYRKFTTEHSIQLYAMCVVEDSYYIHIKIPSDSQKDGKYTYDVIIRFFTDSDEVLRQNHLKNYFVQFYSNSPSFIYQYAYLYKKEGYLIDTLYDKLDKDYMDKPPEKTNSNMHLSYDKSIYVACRFLSEMKFRYLNKTGPLIMKKKDKNKFFNDVSDFQSVKFDQELMAEERKLSKVVNNRKRGIKQSSSTTGKKVASTSTSKNKSITIVGKKGGKSKVIKKTGTRSTRKK